MSNIDKQALRTAAENATPGEWCTDDYHGVIADAGLNANYYIASCSGPDNRSNKRFIAAANPTTVLALLDELEAAEKRIAELEAKQVKIKLPESFYPDGDIECPLVINEYQIIEAIVAADCKPIAVCPRCKCELDLSHKPDGAHYCHATGTGQGE